MRENRILQFGRKNYEQSSTKHTSLIQIEIFTYLRQKLFTKLQEHGSESCSRPLNSKIQKNLYTYVEKLKWNSSKQIFEHIL